MNMPELEEYVLQGIAEGKSLDELTNFARNHYSETRQAPSTSE